MPMTAMVRNLGKMTSIGLLKPLSAASKKVTSKLKDTEQLKKSRIHPMAILIAAKVYESGHGVKGDLSWNAVPAINQALDEAFYLAFGNVRKADKPLLFALDVSGSMGSPIAGSPLSCCEASTALALVHANVEDDYHIMRFNTGIQDTPIRKGMRLTEALKYTRSINGGGTDCALPAQWALKSKTTIGGIVILTDNETYAGTAGHPFQHLTKYRQAMVPDLRQVVVGMTATGFTIADPSDKLSMDVVGFDASAPNVIADFIRGELT
jgi:60 kDa SS-A/Ro ribonucleoprotein